MVRMRLYCWSSYPVTGASITHVALWLDRDHYFDHYFSFAPPMTSAPFSEETSYVHSIFNSLSDDISRAGAPTTVLEFALNIDWNMMVQSMERIMTHCTHWQHWAVESPSPHQMHSALAVWWLLCQGDLRKSLHPKDYQYADGTFRDTMIRNLFEVPASGAVQDFITRLHGLSPSLVQRLVETALRNQVAQQKHDNWALLKVLGAGALLAGSLFAVRWLWVVAHPSNMNSGSTELKFGEAQRFLH